MTDLLDQVSGKVAKAAYFIDVVLCSWIHNPFVLSALVLTGSMLLLAMLFTVPMPDTFANVEFNDYLLDFLHNAINLIFIVRFPASSSRGLTILSSTLAELLLLAIQNVGCAVLLFSSEYSLLYSNMHPILRMFMLWQIVCPYLIFLLHLLENWWRAKNPVSTSEKRTILAPKLLTGSLLVDTNNNFLPVFMAHSFASINFNYPLAGAYWVVLVYKLACFSFKFYLINRYVLYELVMVISDVSDLNSYAELYTPVLIGGKKKSVLSLFSRHATLFLIAFCVVLMGIDGGFMAIAFMK
ncbi:CIC11C00000005564 [Sungouiella intermedia]|uniref:CIC11C00000005564 n=1 Tax=Sungouiella intermedia TaxID=45354 RepID=A0A1L0DCK0_9ASCO|nr:CIC11C00000005564 [[Candida] intermedia]